MKNLKQAFTIIIVNLVLIGLIVLGAELAARWSFTDSFVQQGNQFVFFEFDDHLGWHCIPNTQGEFSQGDEFKVQVSINSSGMRDREYFLEKPKNIRRIAVLGDSFTWGFSVNNDEIFTEVLERQLGKNYEVLNFGVSGFGRGQQWLQLQRDVLAFEPDIVLVMAYPGNDLYDNLADRPNLEIYPRPSFSLSANGELQTHGLPLTKPSGDFAERWALRTMGKWMGLYQRSYLFRVLYHALDSLDKTLEKTKATAYINEIFLVQQLPRIEQGIRVERAILNEMKTELDRRGITLLYALAPSREQVRPQEQAELEKQVTDEQIDWTQPNRLLQQTTASLSIPTFDLLTNLQTYERRGEKVYFDKDFHWNRLGNKVVGQTLAPWIRMQQSQHSLPDSDPQ